MVDPLIQLPPPWRFVADAGQLAAALEALRGEDVLGVDTETYWETASKRMLVSIVQISARSGDVLVYDALAAGPEPLKALVENPEVRMVAHNARFDDAVLRAAGLQPQGFIDTLQLARIALSLPSYSLAAVTEHLFGLPLDKTLRTSNWRRRPLTKAQIAYAASDARITLNLYDKLRGLFEERGTWDAALRAALIKPTEPGRGRPRRRATKAPDFQLTAEEKRLVQALKKWRLEHAHALRVPAYMVCQDKTLEHLARARPATLEALSAIYGLGESKITRFGAELLRALQEAGADE